MHTNHTVSFNIFFGITTEYTVMSFPSRAKAFCLSAGRGYPYRAGVFWFRVLWYSVAGGTLALAAELPFTREPRFMLYTAHRPKEMDFSKAVQWKRRDAMRDIARDAYTVEFDGDKVKLTWQFPDDKLLKHVTADFRGV